MNSIIRVPLNTNPEQFARLQALQSAFAEVCNALAPEVKKSRVWNRVALHHLHYRALREKFPALGSQMICNAIYAVSRASRLVFQTPGSPFNLTKLGDKPLPLLQFADSCPVYFDRHTLSIKGTKLSLFTLDGRMHFELTLPEEQLLLFKVAKLREISLTRRLDGLYELAFWLEAEANQTIQIPNADEAQGERLASSLEVPAEILAARSLIPDYLSIEVAA
ncbi:MAG: hypothetical protein RL103_1817 [Pseudomonadota bacterium]|jgi:hypothetical protein